jgi:ankyrin repeat protein
MDAVDDGYEDVVRLLLDTGEVKIDSKIWYGRTLLLWAAENGDKAVVQLLLDTGEVEINSKDEYSWTPVMGG